jgi:multisubunit Na+/H+ antiporter MnhB subunit
MDQGAPQTCPARGLLSPLLVGCVLLVWTVLLVYLFFGKKKRFPRSAIAFMVISVVGVVVDFAVALTIPGSRDGFTQRS